MAAPTDSVPKSLSDKDLLACLPASLQTPGTSITRVAAGNSGAGVYLVESAEGKAILKITSFEDPEEDWIRSVATQAAAANAGLAPTILHTDSSRRAVLSEFIVDQSFRTFFWNPETRSAAIASVGQMVARLHALPATEGMSMANPFGLLEIFWKRIQPDATSTISAPTFAYDSAMKLLDDHGPSSGRAAVLSHNDMNPTNFMYDGSRVLMLDWQTASLNDPYYDLGTIAMFLRMDTPTCLQLLGAYDGETVTAIPPRFDYSRRLVATLSGSAFLFVALQRGYVDMDPNLDVADVPTLGEAYTELGRGEIQLGTLPGQWRFGLALIKEGMSF